jgi:hypothetical protein
VLGFEPDALHNEVRLRAHWFSDLGNVDIEGVWFAGSRLSLTATPTGARIVGMPNGMHVAE